MVVIVKKTYKCKNCGKIYTSDLGVCPECLAPHKKGYGRLVLRIIFGLFAAMVLVALSISIISYDSSETSGDSLSAGSSAVSDNLTVGSTLSAKGLNITLKKVEDWDSDNMFIQPKDGNKFIRVYFTLENTNSTSRYLGSYDFTCYADNAKTDMSIFGEDTLALGTEVSGGRVLQGYIYYEVPVNAESIQIEYDSDWWGSKAIFIVK